MYLPLRNLVNKEGVSLFLILTAWTVCNIEVRLSRVFTGCVLSSLKVWMNEERKGLLEPEDEPVRER